MRTRYVVGSLLAAALLSSTAFAQNTAPSTAPSRAPAAATSDVTLKGNHWRASKLIGVNIYNEQNDKLGDFSEIILDPSGRVTGYVIGVGGFLGMGQHDILVEPGKIKFVNEPIRSTTSSNTTTNTNNTANNTANNPPAANTPAGAPTNTRPVSNTTRAANEQWYPDHGVLNATKDQLKSMQQFKY
jgi:sporulation protein YlmC with PRC-barrel domain